MKNKQIVVLICMLLIAYAIPVSGVIIPDNVTIIVQDPIQSYRSAVKSLDDGRAAPGPGDLPEDFVFPGSIYDSLEISIPPDKTLGIDNENIIEILLQMDEGLILKYLENITAFGPRVTGSSECAAAGDYIYDEFENMGIEARYDNWSYSGYTGNNIEGTLYGKNQTSDEIYIICAHYDSVNGSPGADDDGSGTAAVLASAYVMSQYQFNHTIRFVAFDGEEKGLLGSHEYAKEAAANGDNIIAVLNTDMIGYAITENDGNNIKIFENDESEWITDFSIIVSQEYYDYIELTIIPSGYSFGSDHYSFWQFGYDAIFYHEYNFNDYYHSPQDTIENMNITYFAKCSKLALATLAELAQPYELSSPPNAPSKPSGNTSGYICIDHNYFTSTSDPHGLNVSYGWDWDGDHSVDEWTDWYESNETCTIVHNWSDPGDYIVRVKAKNILEDESNWSSPLSVTMLNHPPYAPRNPNPIDGATDVPVDAVLCWIGEDSDICDTVVYDVYFGIDYPPPFVSYHQTETCYDPYGDLILFEEYYWKVVAWDNHGASNSSPEWSFWTVINPPPTDPEIDGPIHGNSGIDYNFTFVSTDEDDQNISYYIDWRDGTNSSWTSFHYSGDEITLNHTWKTEGTYIIKAKAKDIYGAESNWSEFEISIPRTRTTFNSLLYWFLERFPMLERLLTLLR